MPLALQALSKYAYSLQLPAMQKVKMQRKPKIVGVGDFDILNFEEEKTE